MVNLHESMGPGQDRTRDPWICNQTCICSQTGYQLCYAVRSYLLCLIVNIFSRISELSSRLLKSGSSDVTELSDPYRAMKLAYQTAYLLCLILNIFSRISELSSRLLKSGSSDVTELSDPYRPMKLAEELNCVYDNEWTDCYEFFTEEKNMKDDEAIDLLFAMIQVHTQFINNRNCLGQIFGIRPQMYIVDLL